MVIISHKKIKINENKNLTNHKQKCPQYMMQTHPSL